MKHFSFNSAITEALKPYCLCTSKERGVMLIEPFQSSPPLKLVYSSYDEETRTNRATLSFKQHKELSNTIRRALNITTPFVELTVSATPTSLLVGFTIDPRVMHGEMVVPCNHPGLSILLVTGNKNVFVWNVAESQINWPSWVERPTF